MYWQAYHNGFYGDYYQWIVYGWYNDKWWLMSDDANPVDCTGTQLYEVLSGSLALQHYPINEQVDKIVVGDLVSMHVHSRLDLLL